METMMKLLAGVLASFVALFMAFQMTRRERVPNAVYYVFGIFALIPVVLLLLPTIEDYQITKGGEVFAVCRNKRNGMFEKSAEAKYSGKKSSYCKYVLNYLENGNDKQECDPTEERIDYIIKSLDDAKQDFAILERGDNNEKYIQTAGGPKKFVVEYRDGSADRHYQCEGDLAFALKAFHAYKRSPEEIGKLCKWKKVIY